MSIRPLNDQIAIRPDPKTLESSGGILLLGGGIDKATTGTVVSTGPGRVKEDGTIREMSIKAGDRVMFSDGGQQIIVDNVILVVMREQDIVGIVT